MLYICLSKMGLRTVKKATPVFMLLELASYCKDTVPKIRNKYIPRNETSSQFLHSCICERWAICTFPGSVHLLLQQNRQTDPGNIQIAHRYMTWQLERGLAVSLLGIHKLNLLCRAPPNFLWRLPPFPFSYSFLSQCDSKRLCQYYQEESWASFIIFVSDH